MTSSDACARVARAVRGAGTIFLAAHENPDADSVGSLLALGAMLLELGKTVHAATPNPPPERFRFLDGFAALTTEPPPGTPDLAIALDCDGAGRLAGLEEAFMAAALTVDIDHHRGVSAFGDIRWVAPDAPATASLVAQLARELELPLTPARAAALYVGLIADTGGFRFTNTSPEALRLGAELVEAGADPSALARCVFTIRPLSAALLEARALASLDMAGDGVLIATLSRDDFVATGASPADTDGLIDSFRDVVGVRTAVLMKESEPGTWQVSLRGNGVDVAGVAARFGGGGHRFAAGFTAEGEREAVERRVLEALAPAPDGGAADA